MRPTRILKAVVLALPLAGHVVEAAPVPGLLDGIGSLLSSVLHLSASSSTSTSKATSTSTTSSVKTTSTSSSSVSTTSTSSSVAVTTTSTSVVPTTTSVAVSTSVSSSTITSAPASSSSVTASTTVTQASTLAVSAGNPISTYVSSLSAVTYTLILTSGTVSPDGTSRTGVLINGQSPGPALQVTEGQAITVIVLNLMSEGATLHWHGIIQDEVWNDGVPGVSQYPIAPLEEFTYTFTPHQHGQYWYHSHFSSQLEDGCRGSFIVHPAPARPRPFSLIASDSSSISQMTAAEANPAIIQLADWNHLTSAQMQANYELTGVDPLCSDSYLVNGRGNQICYPQSVLNSMANAIIQPVTDKGCGYWNDTIELGFFPDSRQDAADVNKAIWTGCTNTSNPLTVIEVNQAYGYASLNLINVGGTDEQRISIDGHQFIVYAADGQYIYPQTADILIMPVGTRIQAFIQLNNPGDWTIRSANSAGIKVISSYSVLSYSTKSQSSLNSCGSATGGLPALCGTKKFYWTSLPSNSPVQDYGGNDIGSPVVLDGSTFAPWNIDTTVPQTSSHTLVWDIAKPDPRLWTLDGTPYLPWRQQATPVIKDPSKALAAGLAAEFALGDVVDIIFNVPIGHPAHPFHKHDVKGWVIGTGDGAFPWSSVAEGIAASPGSFNLDNPPYRDTYRSPPARAAGTWMAVRYQVVHTGVVFLHCHIGLHLANGMAFVLVEDVKNLPAIPWFEEPYLGKGYASNPSPTLVDGYVVPTGA